MKKIIAMLLALVLVMGLFVGCNNEPVTPTTDSKDPAPSTDGATEGTTTEGEPAEIETPLVIQWDQGMGTDQFEPPYINDSLSYHTWMMWSKLFHSDTSVIKNLDFENFFKEDYVTHWDYSEDGKTATFYFREDMVWSDGVPVTAEDGYWSVLASIKAPESTIKALAFPEIVGYQDFVDGKTDTLEGLKFDGYKLIFELAEPNVNYRPSFWVLPAHCFEGVAWDKITTHDYWKAPVTCAPYKFAEAKFPDYVKLVRDDNFYGEKAGIKNVTCLSFKAGGNDAAIASMIAGESTITTRTVTSNGLLANQITNANPDCKILVMPTDNYRSFVFNMGTRTDGKNKASLIGEDPRARQAFSLLADEDTIAAYAGSSACKVMGNPSNLFTSHELDDARKSLDLEQAKKLLDEAGWNYDDTLEIFTWYSDQLSQDILNIFVADCAKIGVKAEIDLITENDTEYQDVTRNYDMLICQVPGSNVYPCSYVENICNPESGIAYVDYESNPWIAETYLPLIQQRKDTAEGSDERTAVYAKMQAEMYEDCIVIPLYVNATCIAYNAAQLYVPETAFDQYDNDLNLHLWKMLK